LYTSNFFYEAGAGFEPAASFRCAPNLEYYTTKLELNQTTFSGVFPDLEFLHYPATSLVEMYQNINIIHPTPMHNTLAFDFSCNREPFERSKVASKLGNFTVFAAAGREAFNRSRMNYLAVKDLRYI
jgi:hypothetical protein